MSTERGRRMVKQTQSSTRFSLGTFLEVSGKLDASANFLQWKVPSSHSMVCCELQGWSGRCGEEQMSAPTENRTLNLQ
jgi:hypothetical protein